MTSASAMPLQAGQDRRRILLNLKCLFWCLHQMRRSYSINLVLHSFARRHLHPDIADSHLGDIIEFLMDSLDDEDQERILEAVDRIGDTRSSIDVGDKHFEIGHYIQMSRQVGPIAEGSNGIICSITPELRGLFYLEGSHLMASSFAPSDVRVIFGTYIT